MGVSADFRRQLSGFSLTTAKILYHFPDYPHLLQTFVWQQHDMFPAFPELRKFLDFWRKTLDGRSTRWSWRTASSSGRSRLKTITAEYRLH